MKKADKKLIVCTIIILILLVSTVSATNIIKKEHKKIGKEIKKIPKNQTIFLKSRHFIPEKGISKLAKEKIDGVVQPGKKVRLLVQFDHIPNAKGRKQLEKDGMTLLDYIPNNAFVVSVKIEKIINDTKA